MALKDQYGENLLLSTCKYSSNIPAIKYLLYISKNGMESRDKNGNNCLSLACAYNSDIKIIKFLIEKCGMNHY